MPDLVPVSVDLDRVAVELDVGGIEVWVVEEQRARVTSDERRDRVWVSLGGDNINWSRGDEHLHPTCAHLAVSTFRQLKVLVVVVVVARLSQRRSLWWMRSC